MNIEKKLDNEKCVYLILSKKPCIYIFTLIDAELCLA